MASQYTVFRMPVASPRTDDFVAKFRETRLAAIRADPVGSFFSHEVEREHPLSVWHARLFDGMACLVCVADANPTLSTEDALLAGDWAGHVIVKEQIASTEYYQYPKMALEVPQEPEFETRWHIFDLFISPHHRGRSAASKLIESSLAAIKEASLSEGSVIERARVRLIVNPKNEWLVRWYRRLGFMDRGSATVTQGFHCNGWSASIPKDTESTEELRMRWHAPIGLIMELIMDVN